MKRSILISAMIVLSCVGYGKASTWITLPIIPSGIDGSNIVGGKQLYNLTTGNLTTLNVPGSITGISGNSIVGYYRDGNGMDNGFIYDMTTQSCTTFDYYPGVMSVATRLYGISGSNIVGAYEDGYGWHGLSYNGTTWATAPTYSKGISGNNIVYNYSGNGFLYNMTTRSSTSLPMTTASAIDGSNIGGGNQFYNLTTGSLTTLNVPGSITGISGNNIVGNYGGGGFLYTIPEPATMLLLGLGGVLLRKRQCQKEKPEQQ